MADIAKAIDKTDLEEAIMAFLPTAKISKQDEIAFLHIAKSFHLNPFKREIYAISYGGKAQIVTGYEVYIKRAERSGKLDGWNVDVSEDGKKASCTIYRKDWNHPFAHIVYLEEARQDNAIWRRMPKFMLRKVAIGQAFRLAFPDELGGMPHLSEETAGTRFEDIPDAQIVGSRQTYNDAEPDDDAGDGFADKQAADTRRTDIITKFTSHIDNYEVSIEKLLGVKGVTGTSTDDLEQLNDKFALESDSGWFADYITDEKKELIKQAAKAAQAHGLDINKLANRKPMCIFESKRIRNLIRKVENGDFDAKPKSTGA